MSAHWDEADVPSLTGKVALVTGANAGLGLATARVLAKHGAKVLLACRNLEKGAAAAEQIRAESGPSVPVEVVRIDLASLASIEEGAGQVRATETHLDVLINNAGLMAVDQGATTDGFETQLGVNHLGHFALTARLAPLVLATPGSRVVTVSSMGHRMGALHLEDLFFETRRYDRWRPYFQSKLANLLFTVELDRRLTEAGAATTAVAAHPGVTHTDLGYEGTGLTNRLMRPAALFMQPPRLGALPIVRAATDPAVRGGEFYGPQFLFWGYPRRETPSRAARNAGDARRLWTRSEKLTGISFDIARPAVG